MAIFLDDFRYRVNRDGHFHERQKFATNRYTLTGKIDRTESGIIQKNWRYTMRMPYDYDPLIDEDWGGYETYRQLADFESDETWTQVSGVSAIQITPNTTYFVEGTRGLLVESNEALNIRCAPEGLQENLAASSDADYIDLWVYAIDLDSDIYVTIQFKVDDNNHFTSPQFVISTTGWKHIRFRRSQFTVTGGNPSWGSIVYAQIGVQEFYFKFVFDDLRLSFVDSPFFPNNEYYVMSGTWEIQPAPNGERLVHVKLAGGTTYSDLRNVNKYDNVAVVAKGKIIQGADYWGIFSRYLAKETNYCMELHNTDTVKFFRNGVLAATVTGTGFNATSANYMKMVATDGKIVGYLSSNGTAWTETFDYTDPIPLPSGYVGLRAGNSAVQFDSLEVTKTEGTLTSLRSTYNKTSPTTNQLRFVDEEGQEYTAYLQRVGQERLFTALATGKSALYTVDVELSEVL